MPGPFGHWQGSVSAPTGEVRIEVDLAKNPKGELIGTFSGANLTGFPLAKVTVEGGAVSFEIPATGGGRFNGQLSGDGNSLSGRFSVSEGAVPFNLVRNGDARMESSPRNAPIRKDMEATWESVLHTDGQQKRFLLKLLNQPDGTWAASIVSLDEGGFELPVAIVQEEANLTIDVKVTGFLVRQAECRGHGVDRDVYGAICGAADDVQANWTITPNCIGVKLTKQKW